MDMTPQAPSPNDDSDIAPEDIEAAAESDPIGAAAPELNPQTEELTEWDDAPASHGTAAPKVPAFDEATIASELVAEGTEEADRDQRIAATDPDFEP